MIQNGGYTIKELAQKFNLPYSTIKNRILRILKEEPIRQDKVDNFYVNIYDESIYDRLVECDKKLKQKKERIAAEKSKKDLKFYRVSVKEADHNGNYHYYIRHIGTSKKKAEEIMQNYRKVGLRAVVIECHSGTKFSILHSEEK